MPLLHPALTTLNSNLPSQNVAQNAHLTASEWAGDVYAEIILMFWLEGAPLKSQTLIDDFWFFLPYLLK